MLGDNFGINTLEPAVVRVPVTKVIVDQNAPFRSPRSRIPLKGRSSMAGAKRSDGSMSSLRDATPQRLNNLEI